MRVSAGILMIFIKSVMTTRTTFLGKTAFLGGFSALKVRFPEQT